MQMEEQRFGRYRVTRTLGTGAMGAVYEAVDDVLGREVAIKTLKNASGITARMADERFRLEARAIAQLSHPGVVQVFDIDLGADPPFIVMERIAGPSLDARIEQGALSAQDVAALGIQIARALAAAHAAGVVHRDVKPSNILATGSGTWKLADFGVAHVPDSALTMTGQFVGSPAYAAPEALVKGMSGAASDVYGLGATLYQAAAGRWPRLEAKGAILAPVPPLAQLAPELPAHVAAAIDRSIALDHEQRPTAGELADLIAAGSISSPIRVESPPLAPRVDSAPSVVPRIDSGAVAPRAGSAPSASPRIDSGAVAPRAGSAPRIDGAVASPADNAPIHAGASRADSAPILAVASLADSAPTPRADSPPTPRADSAPIAVESGPVATNATNDPRSKPRLLPFVILLGLVVAIVAIAKCGSGGDAPKRDQARDEERGGDDELQPGEIRVVPPEGLEANTRAQREWEHVVDQIYKRHYREALDKLGEWEEHFGPTQETTDLRHQLENMPDDDRPRGKHGKHGR